MENKREKIDSVSPYPCPRMADAKDVGGSHEVMWVGRDNKRRAAFSLGELFCMFQY